MNRKPTIAIVDDHSMFRDGLKLLLEKEEIASHVFTASCASDFLVELDRNIPDIVLMDIEMPEMNGIEATKLALKKCPDLKIIALTMFGEQEYYYQMLHAGIRGFMLKDARINELKQAINDVLDGDVHFSHTLLRRVVLNIKHESENKIITPEQQIKLTGREAEVLELICNGLSNDEIADKLNISPLTVKSHRTNLFTKTGCGNAASLVMFAIKNKLIAIT